MARNYIAFLTKLSTHVSTYVFPEYGPVRKGEKNFIAKWSSAGSDWLWINLSWYLDLPHKLSRQTVSGKQLFGVTKTSSKETPSILLKSLLSRNKSGKFLLLRSSDGS